jgi:hypothetical protein
MLSDQKVSCCVNPVLPFEQAQSYGHDHPSVNGIRQMANSIRAFNLIRGLDAFVPRTARLSQRGSVSSKAFKSPFKPNTAIVLRAKPV